jgi:glutamate 5-kinase
LVLLSDIDGLYDADPSENADATLIPEVSEITPDIEKMAGAAASRDSSGGMVTKLAAAKQCLGAGCAMVITKGEQLNPLQALEAGANCTWFVPRGTPQTARKQWIAGTLQPAGALTVDDGAVKALNNGRSLLPAGVADISGDFERGEAIAIVTASGHEIGRGLIAYSSKDAKLIMGHKTGDILELLGYRGRDEMIHRDDLVMN